MARGRPPHPDVLTPRQWEVLERVRDGQSNPEIARELGISTDGAKFHVSEILTKLGVSSRREAAEWEGAPARSDEMAGTPQASIVQLTGVAPHTRMQDRRRRYARSGPASRAVAGTPAWREQAA
ncbi:MAG: helix-turn-helix domain-containing protein [Gemmatimonadaceae bacterium]